MSNLTSTLTLQLKDDGLQAKAKADAEALRKLGASGADLKKLGAANPEIARLTKGLDQLAAKGSKLDAFRAGSRSLKDLGASMRLARGEAKSTAEALVRAQTGTDAKLTRSAEKAHKAALRRSDQATTAFVEQGRAVRGLRKELLEGGVGRAGRGLAVADALKDVERHTKNLTGALHEQVRLMSQASAAEARSAAAAPQRAAAARDALRSAVEGARVSRATRLDREAEAVATAKTVRATEARRRATAGRDMVGGMGGAGRAQLDDVEHRRRIADGMSRPAREAAAEDESARAANAQTRKDARRQIVGAAGLYLGHKVAEAKREILHTYTEFDDLRRYQVAVADLTPDESNSRVKQALHLGGETRFNDLQVLHAQLDLAQRGVKKEFIEPFIGEVVNYAQAMNTDLGSAAKTLEGIVFSTNQNVEDPATAQKTMRRNVDQAVKLAKIGGLDDEDVKEAFKFGGPSGSGAGLHNETMGAIFALLRRSGFAGSEAGVATRAAASKLVSPTTKGLNALAAMGLNYNDYVTMPLGNRPEVAETFFKNKFGKGFTPAQRQKMDDLMNDPDKFGDQNKFIEEASQITSSSFDKVSKGKNAGKLKVTDQKALAKVFSTMWTNMVESVNTEKLMSDILHANPTLQQANAFFTDKHGGKFQALAKKAEMFDQYSDLLRHVIEGFAKSVGDQRNAGYAGAATRLAGSGLNVETALARALDNDGNGGFLTKITDLQAKFTQSIAELPSGIAAALAVGAYAGGKASSVAGAAALTGAATGVGVGIGTGTLSATAVALTGTVLATPAVLAAIGAAAAIVTAKQATKQAQEDGAASFVGKADGGEATPLNPMEGLAPKDPPVRKWLHTQFPGVFGNWGGSLPAGDAQPSSRVAEGVKSLIDQRVPRTAPMPSGSGGAVGSGRLGFGLNGPVGAPNALPLGTFGAMPTIEPKVETGALERLHARADEAKAGLEQVGQTKVEPQVSTGGLDALIQKVQEALTGLRAIPGAAASAASSGGALAGIRARAQAAGNSFSDGVTPGAGP